MLVTPHSAFLTDEALGNIAGAFPTQAASARALTACCAATTVDNINAFARGEALANVVLPDPPVSSQRNA